MQAIGLFVELMKRRETGLFEAVTEFVLMM